MSTDDSTRPAGVAVAARDSEEAILARAGYKPELRRSLRFFSMFAIAFSIISITTGIFLNYSFGLSYWGPASIWTWPIVGVGNLMIALVVAELGTRIPLAGYAYQWSARLVNPTYGWFVGFAGLLYMSVGGGAIMLGVASPLLLSEFNVSNPSPRLVFAVAILLMLLPVVINIISMQVAARVNNIAVFTEIIGTVVFGVLLFVLWALKTKPSPYGASILTNTTSVLHNPTIYAFALAGLIGAFTLVGFELAADMSEDAVNPRQSVPRGVIWAVAGSAVLGMIALIGFTVAIPSLSGVENPKIAPLPLLYIAGYWLPSWLVKVFVAFVIFSMFAILVVGAGAQARLAYSLARDNMLPFSGALRKVNRSTQTPIIALLVFAVVDIGVTWYGYLQTSAFATLVGATAIIPYIIYFLVTAGYAYKRRTLDSIPGAFSLGRWAWPVIIFVLLYSALIIFVLSVPAPFHAADKVVGYGAGLALLWYVAALVWRLRRGTAGVKPVEELVDN
ncbi:MAG TPA: amino acid permease [Streptosporangiaceae bacterium]|nr:amino acid permease [Streptosporangiaceae bacterium]